MISLFFDHVGLDYFFEILYPGTQKNVVVEKFELHWILWKFNYIVYFSSMEQSNAQKKNGILWHCNQIFAYCSPKIMSLFKKQRKFFFSFTENLAFQSSNRSLAAIKVICCNMNFYWISNSKKLCTKKPLLVSTLHTYAECLKSNIFINSYYFILLHTHIGRIHAIDIQENLE